MAARAKNRRILSLSQVKLLVALKWLTELKNRKILSGYHRSNCWLDFHQNSLWRHMVL
jgi:hypothetical protein